MIKVVIVGAGFAGLNAAKSLANVKDLSVILIDRKNHHLFQPLLYQVAMAGLSPAEIASPIRNILSKYKNITVYQDEILEIDENKKQIISESRSYDFDYLILACGAKHSYFGNSQWEQFAPGLKNIEQATEIRQRVLSAFEKAEMQENDHKRRNYLTFIIVGGGPTGVELAGAIGEMSRFTLAKDFKNIDPKLTRIILIEAGNRILNSFSNELSSKSVRDLEKLGVQVWTNTMVTDINSHGVQLGNEFIEAKTVLWAAGVEANTLKHNKILLHDKQQRIIVNSDLSIADFNTIFVLGDQSKIRDKSLPGTAPVAMQQGRYIGKLIKDEIKGKKRYPFQYLDKGQMATIGRSKAIVEIGKVKLSGLIAWFLWLTIHIYYLTGFKNRIFVVAQWAWSYLSFKKGARLILGKNWENQ